METQDKRIFINIKLMQQTHEYEGFKSQIKSSGFFSIVDVNGNIKAKIYTPEMCMILFTNELEVENLDSPEKETIKINPIEYEKTYIEGYKNGVKYFDENFTFNINTLYEKGNSIKKDLHNLYFHTGYNKNIDSGWVFVKNVYPCIITHKIIKEFGYYSGIVSRVIDLVEKYPSIFSDFHKCFDNEQHTPQPTAPKKPQEKTTYLWRENPEKELPELYRLMKTKYELIAPDTTYEQFKEVFTGQPIDEIGKIERTKKFTNVLLTYFVSELFQRSNPNDYISIAENCFVGAKNLSQAQTNYFKNQNNLPKNHNLIDSLLKDLHNAL